uniref:Maleylacetoacetate isomerase n=1 Tax=Spongospora subterranea TaxID=70186 RepID=A0A0H5R7F6_9EUKA|eukprot:CRZ10038.1 hypothetical protein [Spongospora subterranea]
MSEQRPTRLSSYWRSSCSYRVRIALNLKWIPYEYVAINLLKGEQLDDVNFSQSPVHQVPVLEIDGHSLHESMAIIEYLEETRPSQTPLLPKDPYLRSVARRQALIIAADIQPVQNLRVIKYQKGDAIQWCKHFITLGLIGLEKDLSTSAGACCVGDNVTIADICLVPQVYNARRFDVDMSQFPIISRIAAALEKLPAFIAAHPDHQPDAAKQ